MISAAIGYGVYRAQRPEWALERALVAQAENRYDAALVELEQVYLRDPQSPLAAEAMYRAGRLLHRHLKEYRRAVLLMVQMEERYPETPFLNEALLETADIYLYGLQDRGRAIDTFQRLVERVPKQAARFQYQIADAYFQMRNYEQARIEFQQFHKRWPNHTNAADVALRIGLIYALENRHHEAEKAFREVMSTYPNSAFAVEARLALAGVYEDKSEFLRALDQLNLLQLETTDDPRIQQRIDQIRQRIETMKAPANVQRKK